MIAFSPTKRGIILIFISLFSLLLSLTNRSLTVSMVSSCFFALLVVGIFFSFMSIRKIQIKRSPGSDCCVGEFVSIPLTITNTGRLISQAFVIREKIPFMSNGVHNIPVPPLAGKDTVIIQRDIPAEIRGIYKLNEFYLIGGDPAGFFRRVRTFRSEENITIYPERIDLGWMPLYTKKKFYSSSGKPIGVTGLGQDFFGVREYKNIDSMRFIHWKASAKHRELMVREFESHDTTSVNILLDTDLHETVLQSPSVGNLEYLIKIAASATAYISSMNYNIFLAAYDGSGSGGLKTYRGTGSKIKTEILYMLSNLRPSKKNSLELLDEVSSSILANSILYFLSLSEKSGFFVFFDFLVSRAVDIRWIYAPKVNFSHPGKVPVKLPGDLENKSLIISPMILEPNSNLKVLLGNE